VVADGQLETVGEGLQGMNNQLLEKALLDYLETLPEQVDKFLDFPSLS